MSSIFIKQGKEKAILRRHPWIFSGAIKRVDGQPALGETVDVLASDGEFLARAAYSPSSQIRARIWTWAETEQVDADFLRNRLAESIERRKSLHLFEQSDAVRLVHAESDGMPGVIVDQYGSYLVLQCLTAGAEYWKPTLIELLQELTGIQNVYERSDVEVRKLEGLPARIGVLAGEDPQRMLITENDLKFWVDIKGGQKTGFFLDQRSNRQRVRDFSKGRDVLNCFSYTGAFSVYALKGEAKSVHSVEASAEALATAEENLLANGFSADQATSEQGDVFKVLRAMRDGGQKYDLIILDPPKFAPTAAQAHHAARGYKDINLLAFKLLRPGGLLFTFSCSGGISEDLFQKIVAGAALDAGVNAQIIQKLSQGADHPVALNFPEGAYLKGLVCSV